MVNSEKGDVCDDATKLNLHQPVLGGDERAEVVQKTQGNASLVRFEERANEDFDAGQSEPDGDGGGFVDQRVLVDVDNVLKVRPSVLEPRGQAVATLDLKADGLT